MKPSTYLIINGLAGFCIGLYIFILIWTKAKLGVIIFSAVILGLLYVYIYNKSWLQLDENKNVKDEIKKVIG